MMATKIYEDGHVTLVDGTKVYLKPLKIKYLRQFMEAFDLIKLSTNDDEALHSLSACAMIALSSQCERVKTYEDFEDLVDLPTLYDVISITAGIKIKDDGEEPLKDQAEQGKSNTWDDLDLAELESEVFLLGIWKDYEDLESSLSMPEMLATLSAKRDSDYQEKKFLAAIQGVDLDKESGQGKQNEWEEMKSRVFSKGKTEDPNDIMSFQGVKANKAGFGLGMGLDFEDLT